MRSDPVERPQTWLSMAGSVIDRIRRSGSEKLTCFVHLSYGFEGSEKSRTIVYTHVSLSGCDI